MFFSGQNYEFGNRSKKRYNFERLKVETWILELRWGLNESFLVQILGVIGHVIRVFETKTEMPIGGLNSSSSKTNRSSGIKVSNLEAFGQAVSAPKNKLWRFRHFFFLYLFIFK